MLQSYGMCYRNSSTETTTGENARILNVGLLDVNITGNRYVGSLVGSNQSTITGSYAIVKNIKGTAQTDTAVGGLVGYNNYGTITKSYALVEDIIGGGSSVGGLVGKTVGGAINHSYARVDRMEIGNLLVCANENSLGRLIDKLVGTNDTNNPTAINESAMVGGCN